MSLPHLHVLHGAAPNVWHTKAAPASPSSQRRRARARSPRTPNSPWSPDASDAVSFGESFANPVIPDPPVVFPHATPLPGPPEIVSSTFDMFSPLPKKRLMLLTSIQQAAYVSHATQTFYGYHDR